MTVQHTAYGYYVGQSSVNTQYNSHTFSMSMSISMWRALDYY